MAVQQKREVFGINATYVIIALGIIAAVAAAGIFLHQRDTPSSTISPAAVKQRTDLFQAMALACHGNFSQLSAADQATVQKATGNNGPMVMKMTALHYGYH